MRQRILGLLVAATVGLTLSGCGPSTQQDAAVKNILGQGAGNITVWAGDDQIPGLQPVAARYEQDTGVGVELVQRNYSAQMISEFLTQVPTGQGPDIIVAPHDVLGQLVANGAVAPIEMGPDAREFLDVAMQAVTYQGTVYGVPFGIENVVLLRNNELASNTPDTFDALIEQGQQLVESGQAKYPVLINQSPEAGDPYHLYPLQTSFGAQVFEMAPDGSYTNNLAMGGEGGREFAKYLDRLGKQGVLNTSLTADIAKQAFINGQSPYLISGPWNVADIRAAGLDITALEIPSAGGEPSRPFVGVQTFFINANSDNPIPAQDFVTNYLSQPKAQLSLFESANRPPALKAAVEQIADDEILSAYARIAESDGVPMPAIPAMGSVWSFWGTTENGIVNDQGDAVTLWERMIQNIKNEIR